MGEKRQILAWCALQRVLLGLVVSGLLLLSLGVLGCDSCPDCPRLLLKIKAPQNKTSVRRAFASEGGFLLITLSRSDDIWTIERKKIEQYQGNEKLWIFRSSQNENSGLIVVLRAFAVRSDRIEFREVQIIYPISASQSEVLLVEGMELPIVLEVGSVLNTKGAQGATPSKRLELSIQGILVQSLEPAKRVCLDGFQVETSFVQRTPSEEEVSWQGCVVP